MSSHCCQSKGYKAILRSGLLKSQHLEGVFLNIKDVLLNSTAFLEKLQAAKRTEL
jgi:hypothetical protein